MGMQTLVARCECGCGSPAPVTRGKQMRFVAGHNSRLSSNFTRRDQTRERNSGWLGDNASGNGIHTWLRKNFPKAGACSNCGTKGKTDRAFLRHPEPYTRDTSDYAELCRSCHIRFDRGSLKLAVTP